MMSSQLDSAQNSGYRKLSLNSRQNAPGALVPRALPSGDRPNAGPFTTTRQPSRRIDPQVPPPPRSTAPTHPPAQSAPAAPPARSHASSPPDGSPGSPPRPAIQPG